MNNLIFYTKNRFHNLITGSIFILILAIGAAAQDATPSPTATPTPQPDVAPVFDSNGLPTNLPEIAPDYSAPQRPLPSVERVGVEVSDQKPLSLNEAITLALENSNDIETSQVDVKLSEFNLKSLRGVYDPRFTSENYYQRAKVPTASSLGGVNGSTTSTGFVNSFGITGNSPFAGGSYSSSFRASRETTNNPFNSLNPQFPSSFSLSYTQPLWRGLRTDNNRRQIEIAKKNLSLSDAQFRQRSIDVITNVIQAYWDLTYALRNLQVQTDAVKQARAQVESNRRQVEQGTIAPIEIIEAETQVTNFEQQVYNAQQSVTRAENTLKTLMLPDSKNPLWQQAVVPTTPVNVEPPRITVDEALAEARENRPELDQLRTNKEINQINTRYFRDQTKPQIDLVGSFTSNGLAGTELASSGGLLSSFAPLYDRVNQLSAINNLPPIVISGNDNSVPSQLVGGYGASLRNLFNLSYPTYQVGVRIDLPFGNRTAKANLGYSLAEGTKIDAQFDQQDQLIKADVQNSLQAMRAAEARLNAAAASRNSSEQLYESEKRKLENGTSTVYLVLQRQQNLVIARGNELQAQTDLNKAIAALQKSIGSTFQSHNIEIKETSQNGKSLKISKPAEADLDSGGLTRSNPRISPPISRPTQSSALIEKP